MQKNYDKIKNMVNAFSESMQNQFKKGSNVTVGGKIISIKDVTLLIGSNENIFDLEIDDGVGTFTLRIFKSLYDEISSHYGQIKEGDFILAEGLFVESISLEEKEQNLVIGHIIKPINEEEVDQNGIL